MKAKATEPKVAPAQKVVVVTAFVSTEDWEGEIAGEDMWEADSDESRVVGVYRSEEFDDATFRRIAAQFGESLCEELKSDTSCETAECCTGAFSEFTEHSDGYIHITVDGTYADGEKTKWRYCAQVCTTTREIEHCNTNGTKD